MNLLERFCDGLSLRRVPAERLAWIRIWVGLFALIYLIARFSSTLQVLRFSDNDFSPIGIWSWLSVPLDSSWVLFFYLLTVLLCVLFIVGRFFFVVGPLFSVLLLSVLSYRNSWGMVFHTENLLVLHVLVLGVSPAADALVFRKRSGHTPSGFSYAIPLKVMSVLTVSTYLLAGIAKLRIGGLDWISGEVLRNHIAYDNLRKLQLGDVYSPLGGFLSRFDILWVPLSWFTLVLELSAPLALFSRVFSRYWVLMVWSFHFGVVLLMMIVFPYPLLGFAYLSFFPIERWMRPLLRVLRIRTERTPALENSRCRL